MRRALIVALSLGLASCRGATPDDGDSTAAGSPDPAPEKDPAPASPLRMTVDEEALSAISESKASRHGVIRWAGPDAEVVTLWSPAVEGISFFQVEATPAGGPPTASTLLGVVWVKGGDRPLEGAYAMKEVAARTRDPAVLAEAALILFFGGGELVSEEPPALDGPKLTFPARVPAGGRRQLALIELDLDTMKVNRKDRPREE